MAETSEETVPHRVFVGSETARLRRVVVQRPGAALASMLPRHIEPGSEDYLLFDDLVHVPDAQREHDQLAAVLRTTAEVRYFDDMVRDALALDKPRAWLLKEVARLEGLRAEDSRRLGELEPDALAAALVTGRLDGQTLMNPLPNLLFARDLAAVVGGTLVVGNAPKLARRRESLLSWAVFNNDPWFAGARISDNSRWVREAGGSFPLTIEGGDVLVLSSSLALIGASERTSWSMIVSLAHELVDHGFTRILVVEMPKQRSSMHLDTVFTIADWDTAVLYPPILQPGGPEECHVLRLRKLNCNVAVDVLNGDLLEVLAAEGYPMRAVLCGDGDPMQAAREQWTDGSNYVALSPGVVVGYARNKNTANAMAKAGYQVVSAQGWLELFEQEFGGDYGKVETSGRRFAIHIVGSELSRGRGGPRCLTLPVQRE